MLRKVLVIHKKKEQGKQIFGLLSFESGERLNGRLKVFDSTDCNNLVIKIGENFLVFENIENLKEFDFEIGFYDLNQPICAILTDGTRVGGTAKSEECEIDANQLLQYFQKNSYKIEKMSAENEKLTDKTDLKEKVENTENFLDMIKQQLDALFSQNEHFKELEDALTGTEWVKVSADEEGFDHYILGKLYDGDVVTHIAYGTFAENQKQSPPQGLEKYCQFLPLNPQDENSAGYYVMYQDAITGENVIL